MPRTAGRPGGKDKLTDRQGWSTGALVAITLLASVLAAAAGASWGPGLVEDDAADVRMPPRAVAPAKEAPKPALRPPAASPKSAPESPAAPPLPPGASSRSLTKALFRDSIKGEHTPVTPVELGRELGGAQFYMVDNPLEGSDPILDFLFRAERHVMEAFTWSLDRAVCEQHVKAMGGFLVCPEVSGPADGVWMADVGANSGFYGMLAGSLGYPVVFVEPQPHCVQYIRTAALASGLGERTAVLNAFAGDEGHASFDKVQLRTGCWGTFPYLTKDQIEGLARFYDGKPEWRSQKGVPMVTLDDVVLGTNRDRDVVLGAVKIDVEGAESPMLRGASTLLEEGRIHNIVMELNKPAWARGKVDPKKETVPQLTKLGKLGFRCRLNTYGAWEAQADFDLSEARLMKLMDEGWGSFDMWCSLEASKRRYPAKPS